MQKLFQAYIAIMNQLNEINLPNKRESYKENPEEAYAEYFISLYIIATQMHSFKIVQNGDLKHDYIDGALIKELFNLAFLGTNLNSNLSKSEQKSQATYKYFMKKIDQMGAPRANGIHIFAELEIEYEIYKKTPAYQSDKAEYNQAKLEYYQIKERKQKERMNSQSNDSVRQKWGLTPINSSRNIIESRNNLCVSYTEAIARQREEASSRNRCVIS